MPQIPIHLVPFEFSNLNFIVTLWVYYMHIRTARGLTIRNTGHLKIPCLHM